MYKRQEYKDELYFTDAYNSFIKYDCGDFDTFLKDLCDSAKNNSAETTLDYLIENTKLEQYYLNLKLYQSISNLSKLRGLAYDSLSEIFMPSFKFLEFITYKINAKVEEDEAPISEENRKKGVVSAYTIHKAKGLSFPTVIIANMDEPLINPKKFLKFLRMEKP